MFFTSDDILGAIDAHTLKNLVNDNANDTVLDMAKIDKIVNSINEMITDKLRGRYDLESLTSSEVLKQIGIDLALYKIYELRNRTSMPEGLQKSWDNNMKLLIQYQTGQSSLDVGTAETRPGFVVTRSRSKVWPDELLDKM